MSSLKDQLNRRKEKLGLSQHTSIHVRPSLLFDAKDAAKIDLHSLYHLSLSGLTELKKEDPRFKSFEATLFSPSSKEVSRELQTKEVNKRLDESLETFLHLLSPFFLKKSAHKVLEYLIRRYSIHDFNKDALMRCIIPFHQSVVFIRMIQNMKLTGTMWEFLADSQSTGYPPKRQVLVNYCLKNRNFLTFICDTVKSFVERRIVHKPLHSFYIALTMEIMSHPRLPETYIRDLWPYIISGLTSQDEDYQSSSMMLLTTACWKTSVSEELIQIGVEEMLSNTLIHLHTSALLTLIIILQNVKLEKGKENESIEKYVPLSVIRIIMEWRDISDCLANFVKQSYDISTLVSFILYSFTKELWKEKILYENLVSLIKNVDIEEHIPFFTYSLLKAYSQENNNEVIMDNDEENEDDSENYETEDFVNVRKESIIAILRYLDTKYPSSFDKGIDKFLSEKNNNKDINGEELVEKFKEVFENSRHHPIFIPEDGVTTTLQLSLKSEHTNIKKFSISILLNLYDDESNFGIKELTQKSILEYLSGNDKDIIMSCLDIPNLLDIVDHDILFDVLEKLVYSDVSQSNLEVLKKSLSILFKFIDQDNFKSRLYCILLINAFHQNEDIRSYTLQLASKESMFKVNQPKSSKRSRRSSEPKILQLSQLIMDIAKNIDLHWNDIYEIVTYMLNNSKTSILMIILLNCSISYSKKCRTLINTLLPTILKDVSSFNENLKPVEFNKSQTKGVLIDDMQELQKIISGSKKLGLYLNLLTSVIFNILETLNEMGSYNPSDDEILTKIFTTISSLPTLFDEHLSLLLKYISSGESILIFLSKFWVKKDSLLNISTCTMALRQANNCLQSIKKISFELIQILIPSFMILLSHKSNNIRSEAFPLIESFVSSKKKVSSKDTYIIDFMSLITQRKNEIITSKTFIRHYLYNVLCEDEAISNQLKEKVLNFMVKSVLQQPFRFSQYSLLTILREVSNAAKLSECISEYEKLLNLFKECDRFQTKSHTDEDFPSFWDCKVMDEMIKLFDSDSSSLLMNNEHFPLLINSLETHVVIEFAEKKSEKYVFNLQISMLSRITQSFFDSFSYEYQKNIFNTLCSLMAHSDLKVKEKAKSILKGLKVDPLIIEEELIQCSQSTESNEQSSSTPKRRKISKADEDEIIEADIQQWISKIIVLLEMLQYKDDILKTSLRYIKPLFSILAKFLHKNNPFVNDPSSEYIEQLLLLTLISITEAIANGKNANEDAMDIDDENISIALSGETLKEVEKDYDVHLIIEFMRMRANPTIQNKALTLISHISRVFPSKVLENITAIFSFMGASSERSEDNYTYEVITKAIDRIIPALLSNQNEENRVSASLLLSVFIERIENIPNHRRLLLFEHILTKVLKRGYLPYVIALFLQKQYSVSFLDDIASTSTPKKLSHIQFVLSLCHKLSPTECIVSFVLLFRWLSNYEDESKKSSLSNAKDLQNVNKIGLRQYLLMLTMEYITSKTFLSRVATLPKEKQHDMQKCYFNLFQSILLFSKKVSSEQDNNRNIQKEVTNLVLNLLDEVNNLLSINTFFNVIESLMKINDAIIKNRALTLFNEKVKQYSEDKNYWKNHAVLTKHALKLLEFSKKLFMIVSKEDSATNKQTASLTIEILCRVFGHIDEIQPKILEFAQIICDHIVNYASSPAPHKENDIKVQASMILTMASITSTLGAKILPYLNKFFPSILTSLKLTLHEDKENDHNQLLRVACLTSIQVIAASVHRFMSNFWSSVFQTLICKEFSDSKFWPQITSIIGEIASYGQPRVLLEPLENTFKEVLANQNDKKCILLLVSTTGYVANFMDRITIKNYHKVVFNLYLQYFDFIVSYEGHDSKEIESSILDSFKTFILKLNESLFKPLFLYILDWAKITSVTASKLETEELRSILFTNKMTFFYKIVDTISNELKDVFISYYNYLIENIVLILNEIHSVKKSEPNLKNKDYTIILHSLISILCSALNKLFTYDEGGMVFDKLKFEKLMPVLIDQIELTYIGTTLKDYKDRMRSKVIPCIAQMALCVNKETLWKPLNHRVLMKARSQDHNVRISAIDIISSLYQKLGEQFLVLLPESVQTFSELLEDSNPEVESQCMKLIKEIEDIIGEEGSVMSLLSR